MSDGLARPKAKVGAVATGGKKRWTESITAQLEENNGTDKFMLKAPSRCEVIEWIEKAWGELSTRTIASGFSTILKEKELEAQVESDFNALADKLESCNLLDEQVDVVTDHDDVVDIASTREENGDTSAPRVDCPGKPNTQTVT